MLERETRTTTHTTNRLKLTPALIREILMREGIDLPTHGVDFYVDVPGGGDWSNSRLSLETAPAVIEWTEVKHNV